MACITHSCTNCGWDEFNNRSDKMPCPKCGGEMVMSFDEQEFEEEEEEEASDD